jgi:predicted nuclease of predicted toxin-antitoxin system
MMKILIDMNLSPDWVGFFAEQEIQAIHWIKIGDPQATDRVLFDWARENQHIIFTHDLDFGIILALANERGPSVIQLRTQNTMPIAIGDLVMRILQQYRQELAFGALITIDEAKQRVRLLPLRG